jgi:hypothetical protein
MKVYSGHLRSEPSIPSEVVYLIDRKDGATDQTLSRFWGFSSAAPWMQLPGAKSMMPQFAILHSTAILL